MTNLIGQRLEKLRLKIKQPDYIFARAIKASFTHITRVERGEAPPVYLTLLRISEALGIPIEKLVKGDSIKNYEVKP